MVKPTDEEVEDLKGRILLDLLKHGYVGGRHTNINNIPKGFPKNERKLVKKVAKILITEYIIDSHPTSYGTEISINPGQVSEIIELQVIVEACNNDPFLEAKIRKYVGS
jgi:hypothetical protein